jgi:hypothetical protein
VEPANAQNTVQAFREHRDWCAFQEAVLGGYSGFATWV